MTHYLHRTTGPDVAHSPDIRSEEPVCATIGRLREALKPLAAKKVPPNPQGNAGMYSFLFAEIEAAKAALSACGDGRLECAAWRATVEAVVEDLSYAGHGNPGTVGCDTCDAVKKLRGALDHLTS